LVAPPGRPRDAADVNVFLASDLSRFATGQTIAVDGGMLMMR
jgi:NAD(P)-dependent dehydrogenase (short-subunit alcohol dehydrogenase family)